MGSRVTCSMFTGEEFEGLVVGASKGGTEGWIIHVRITKPIRLRAPMMFRPSELRAAAT